MKLKNLAILAAMMFIAVPTFAAEGGAPAGGGFVLPVAFAMAIASGMCGMAQGKAVSAAAEGMARNPGAAAAIRITLLLGLAFIESLALFTFVKVG
jgi:F-type H+-transporting ATPase subunit c